MEKSSRCHCLFYFARKIWFLTFHDVKKLIWQETQSKDLKFPRRMCRISHILSWCFALLWCKEGEIYNFWDWRFRTYVRDAGDFITEARMVRSRHIILYHISDSGNISLRLERRQWWEAPCLNFQIASSANLFFLASGLHWTESIHMKYSISRQTSPILQIVTLFVSSTLKAMSHWLRIYISRYQTLRKVHCIW